MVPPGVMSFSTWVPLSVPSVAHNSQLPKEVSFDAEKKIFPPKPTKSGYALLEPSLPGLISLSIFVPFSDPSDTQTSSPFSTVRALK